MAMGKFLLITCPEIAGSGQMVIHSAVENNELFAARYFHIGDTRHVNSRFSDQIAAGR